MQAREFFYLVKNQESRIKKSLAIKQHLKLRKEDLDGKQLHELITNTHNLYDLIIKSPSGIRFKTEIIFQNPTKNLHWKSAWRLNPKNNQ